MTGRHLVADWLASLKQWRGAPAQPGLSRDVTATRAAPGRAGEEARAVFVDIRYLGSVRRTTGERALRWEKPEATLRELLRDLAAHYGPRFRYWVLERGNRPGAHIVVRINGRDARYLDDVDTRLHTGDRISVASTLPLRPRL